MTIIIIIMTIILIIIIDETDTSSISSTDQVLYSQLTLTLGDIKWPFFSHTLLIHEKELIMLSTITTKVFKFIFIIWYDICHCNSIEQGGKNNTFCL